MNECCYTSEKNVLILIALLKAHGIKRIIANPGNTNISFVGSVQSDPFFEVYSGIDERHSAYMACGMAAESGEPVVICCTEATASRNYIPALTEAYYRKLPVLAITGLMPRQLNGQLRAQAIDRSVVATDIARLSVLCPVIKDETDATTCVREMNRAILELTRHGGGPVHIDLETSFSTDFSCKTLPEVRKMSRYLSRDLGKAPHIGANDKVMIFCGSTRLDPCWETFVKAYNAVVISDNSTCGSVGHQVVGSFLCTQENFGANPDYANLRPDLIIDIGEISGDYPLIGFACGKAPVWRVSSDGELRERLGRLEAVFEMTAEEFVSHYDAIGTNHTSSYYEAWSAADRELRKRPLDLPFSNPWIARETSRLLPRGSRLHLGILNSLRSWNCFPPSSDVFTFANVGGFGIDGCVSSLVGSSLIRPEALHFGVVGDLAFLYDMNALGNRHVGKNLRLMVVNNGCGCEFNLKGHRGALFGQETNDYIAAGGHFAKNRAELLQHYAEDNGFQYISASTKEEFLTALPIFLSAESEKSIFFECFIRQDDEVVGNAALSKVNPFDPQSTVSGKMKAMLPTGLKSAIKGLVR